MRVWLLLAVLVTVVAGESRIMWSGAVTPTSATIVVSVVESERATGSLVLSPNPDLSSPEQALALSTVSAGVVRWSVTSLTEDTQYYYGLSNGLSDIGKFKTFQSGAFSFKFALASCAFTGNNHAIFDQIRAEDPAFFLHMGDLHYEDIEVNDEAVRNASYHTVFGATRQAQLWRNQPVTYMWDDHDFGSNNAKGDYTGKPAAQQAYRTFVPHYPLGTTLDDGPLYQAWTVGRVRFVLTDLRSDSNLPPLTNSTLGATQRAWLFSEFATHASYGMMVWISSKPWQGNPEPGSDKWRGYPEERELIANKIKELNMTNLVMFAGDAHIVAADDGSHTDYATGGGAGFPLLHAAPMAQYGSDKGTGPFTAGCNGWDFWITHQFATCEIQDDGDEISFTWKGYEYGTSEPLLSLSMTPPFLKTGIAGAEGCSIPLVPTFMWVVLFMMITSVLLPLLCWCGWLCIRRKKLLSADAARAKAGLMDWSNSHAATATGAPPDDSTATQYGKYVVPAIRDPLARAHRGSGSSPRDGQTISMNPIHAREHNQRRPTITLMEPMAAADFGEAGGK